MHRRARGEPGVGKIGLEDGTTERSDDTLARERYRVEWHEAGGGWTSASTIVDVGQGQDAHQALGRDDGASERARDWSKMRGVLLHKAASAGAVKGMTGGLGERRWRG